MMARPGDVRGLALVGRHAERRVALQVLDRLEAFALRPARCRRRSRRSGSRRRPCPCRRHARAASAKTPRRRPPAACRRLPLKPQVGGGRGAGGKALGAGRRRGRKRRWPRRPRPCPAARRRARRRRCRRAISAGRDGRRSGRPPGSSRRKRRAHRPRSRRARRRPAPRRSCATPSLPPSTPLTEPLSTAKPALRRPARDASAETSGARIDDGGDLQSGGERGLDRPPAVVVVGEQRDALCRRGGVAVDIGAHGRRHHDAGRVVAGKDDRPLDRAGGDDAALGDDAPQPLARLVRGRRRHDGR